MVGAREGRSAGAGARIGTDSELRLPVRSLRAALWECASWLDASGTYRRAARLNVSVAELAAAAIHHLVARPPEDCEDAARRVIEKSEELYRRLS